MTTTPLDIRTDTRKTLSPGATLVLLATIVTAFLAGSSAPTPLYAVYQADWGFSPITTTVVFGIYALAVLTSLLVFGRISDHLGRRPVLLVAIGLQVVTMLVFTFATGVGDLLIARIIQGLSTGAALGALGAAMLEVSPKRGTITNAVAPVSGTALGSLVSGVLVDLLPWPTHLIYLTLLGVFAIQAVAVLRMQETVVRKPGATRTLVPQLRLPGEVRRPFLAAAPTLVAVWALAGLYGSLGPSLIRTVTGSDSVVLAGLGFFVLAGGGALSVLAMHRVDARAVMLTGIVALLVGVAVTMIAIQADSAVLFFAGTAIAGLGFGGGFQGSIRTVVPRAQAHERAGVLSLLFTVSYLSMGLPAVIAGVLVVHDGGLTTTAMRYATGMLGLTLFALVAALLTRERAAVPVVTAESPRILRQWSQLHRGLGRTTRETAPPQDACPDAA